MGWDMEEAEAVGVTGTGQDLLEQRAQAEGAKREAARSITKRIFATLSLVVLALSIIVVGVRDDWAFVGDFDGPYDKIHWEAWRDILAAIVGGATASLVVSVGFTRLAIKNVLTQLVDTRITQIINQDHSRHQTVYPPADNGEVRGELSALRNQVETLKGLLADREANPADVAQLKAFLEYGEGERNAKLKQQLREDAEVFDRVREAMSRFTAEFETQSTASRRAAE